MKNLLLLVCLICTTATSQLLVGTSPNNLQGSIGTFYQKKDYPISGFAKIKYGYRGNIQDSYLETRITTGVGYADKCGSIGIGYSYIKFNKISQDNPMHFTKNFSPHAIEIFIKKDVNNQWSVVVFEDVINWGTEIGVVLRFGKWQYW